MSSVPNRIPDIDVNKDNDTKTIYGLYSTHVYDDGHQNSHFITLEDTLNDDQLSDKIQTIFDNNALHCKANKIFTPYTLVIRKVRISITTETIETCTKRFTPDFELYNPMCENCNELISYGDEVYVYNNQKFCSPECIAEYIKVKCVCSGEDGYDRLFK